MSRHIRAILAAAATAAALAGCGGTPPAAPAAPAPSAAPSAAPAAPAEQITVADPWVKTAESGMTAVFGTFTTAGNTPVTIVSAQTSASPRTELHEVVMSDGAMKMRPKEGGFLVEPGTPHVLAPGGDHIMIMDLAAPIRAGDQVDVTLSLSDGSTTSFRALAKDTTGGEENYESADPAAPGMTMAPAPMAPAGHGG
jgi:copper(I)-binding protein